MTIGVYIGKSPNSWNCYVGSSIDCENRIAFHKRRLFLGNHTNGVLQTAFDKHSLEWYVVYEMPANKYLRDRDLLREIEENFIDDLPGRRYNLTSHVLAISADPRVGRKISATHLARLKSGELYSKTRDFINVALKYKGNDCLEWPYCTNSHGYGKMSDDGVNKTTVQIICEKMHGPAPSKLHSASYLCNSRSCCNSRHMKWMLRNEIAAHQLIKGTKVRGERHGHCKLTEKDVLAIREKYLVVKQYTSIAREYNVGINAVKRIITGDRWGWLNTPAHIPVHPG